MNQNQSSSQNHNYKEAFKLYYEQNIAPYKEKFEVRRLKISKLRNIGMSKFKKYLLIGIILTPIIFFFSNYPINTDSIIATSLSFLAYLIFIAIRFLIVSTLSIETDYQKKKREIIFPIILDFFNSSLSYKNYGLNKKDIMTRKLGFFLDYDPDFEIPFSTINPPIVPSHNYEMPKHKISGEYNNIKINILHTELYQYSRAPHVTKIFHGLMIKLTTNQKFNSITAIEKKDISSYLHIPPASEITLESDLINKKEHKILSTNEQDAKNLLSEEFLQIITEMTTEYKSKEFRAAFHSNNLFISLPTNRDIFQLSCPYDPEDFIEESEEMLKIMSYIFRLIDYLSSDQIRRSSISPLPKIKPEA